MFHRPFACSVLEMFCFWVSREKIDLKVSEILAIEMESSFWMKSKHLWD